MVDDNRYQGSPEFWVYHEQKARGAAWLGRLIEAEELRNLPLQAQTAFAARCAIRARYLLQKRWQGSAEDELSLDDLIDFVVRFSCGESRMPMKESFAEVDRKYRAVGAISERAGDGDFVIHECLEAIYDAGRVAARVAGHLAPST